MRRSAGAAATLGNSVLLVACGILGAYSEFPAVGMRLAWLVLFGLLAPGTAGMFPATASVRVVASITVGVLGVLSLNRGYDEFTDELADNAQFPVQMLLGGLMGGSAVAHVLRVLSSVADLPTESLSRRILRRAAIGVRLALPSSFAVGAALWYLLPLASGVNLPEAIQRGPAEDGRLSTCLSVAAAIVLAGAVIGAWSAIVDEVIRQRPRPSTKTTLDRESDAERDGRRAAT